MRVSVQFSLHNFRGLEENQFSAAGKRKLEGLVLPTPYFKTQLKVCRASQVLFSSNGERLKNRSQTLDGQIKCLLPKKRTSKRKNGCLFEDRTMKAGKFRASLFLVNTQYGIFAIQLSLAIRSETLGVPLSARSKTSPFGNIRPGSARGFWILNLITPDPLGSATYVL